eukprot:TRINITY_DN2223_c0_g1_i6.p1 TRINITY_DN2223_c0_g1~~TRINITY_DN2223_c0_g1_i6.p1  ORF type:complete len:216 (-),score=17.93 TRINITY_DN2223_c0_g1_i6:12-659(-)
MFLSYCLVFWIFLNIDQLLDGLRCHPTLDPTWWDDPESYEYPHWSRNQWTLLPSLPGYSPDEVNEWYYNRRLEETNLMICRQVLLRCLPDLSRQVGSNERMYVCQMDSQLWKYWAWSMTSAVPCTSQSVCTQKYPDWGCQRNESLESIEWKGDLPPLQGKGWNRMKTVTLDQFVVYRAEVTSLKLIRNSWSHLVSVEFEYKMQFHHDWSNEWREC